MIASGGAVLAGPAGRRARLPEGNGKLMPSMLWPEDVLATGAEHDAGPVTIEITRRVRAENRDAFLQALKALSAERRPDGGYRWHVFEDAGDPELKVEVSLVPSWPDHLRKYQRVTDEDANLQAKVAAFRDGPDPPRVRHLLAGCAR